jgi:archaellum component FlaC
MSSVKYVQPNSLIANIKEKIDELNRKIIPTCTLKHSDQKQNVLQLVGKFKEAVQNILSQLNQNEVDYNTINFDELNESLEKAYKLLLDEIVLPYEKIDITAIINRLNELEKDLQTSIDDKRGELDELAGRVSIIEDERLDPICDDIDYLKDEVTKNVTVPSVNEKWNSVRDKAFSAHERIDVLNGEVEDRCSDLTLYLDPLYFEDVPKLKTDVSKLNKDVDEIKQNMSDLETGPIQTLTDDVHDHYEEFFQLQKDVNKLKGDVQKLQASPSGGGTTQALPYPVSLIYDITSEEWTQLIFFLLSAVHYSGNLNLQTFKNQCQTRDGDPADIFNEWLPLLRAAKNSYW